MAQPSRSRTPLSERLVSLFPDSPLSSADSSRTSSPKPDMRRALSTKIATSSAHAPAPHFSNTKQPHPEVARLSTGAEQPRVLWINPPDAKASDSPSSALRDAMAEEVFTPPPGPRPPPSARLPPSFVASRTIRPPILLDSLTRSTLPTSSISLPHPIAQIAPVAEATGSIVRHTPQVHRASLQSLRSLNQRARGVHSTTSTLVGPTSPASRWWFQEDNKKAVDEFLDEEDQADTVAKEKARIRRKCWLFPILPYLSPKNPVVFCHGLFGFDSIQLGPASFTALQFSHWRGIKEVLEANGVEVLITRVPATSSIAERASVLQAKIEEVYTGRDIHLIGHSMGGLDCRYLVSQLPIKFNVLSVTTLATPHRGSYFADYFISTIGRERIPSVVNLASYLPIGGGDGQAFESLTRGAMQIFNENTPDKEGVRYFSWGAAFEPGLLDTFKFPHSVILEKEGPNDGLVSVESSKWGTYLGTLKDVNHLDLVGWTNTARYKWAQLTGKTIKFKPATFYLGIASTLAKEVEGITDPNDKGNPYLNQSPEASDSLDNVTSSSSGKPDKGKQKATPQEDSRDSSSSRSASPEIDPYFFS